MIISDHILMGSIIGLSLQPFDGYVLAAAVGGSLLPDIDYVHGGPGTIGYLDKHRTYTHSLLLAPAFTFLLAVILYAGSFLLKYLFDLQPADSIITLWSWCLLGAIIHLLVDILNPFGTSLWWPIRGRVAMDILFEFDFAFSLLLIIGFIVVLLKLFSPDLSVPERCQLVLTIYLIYAVYILLRAVSRLRFKNRIKDKFVHLLKESNKASFVPAGLWRWKAILETEDKHYVIRQYGQDLGCEECPKIDLSAIPPLMQVEEVNIYYRYARYLNIQVQDKYLHLRLSNLIYSSQVLPLIGCFADPQNPLIKIEKPKWLRVLCERHY